MWLDAAVAQAIASFSKNLLALDVSHRRWLSPLAGKVIAIELLPIGHRIILSFTLDKVLVLPEGGRQADLVLRGSPLAFARLVSSSSPRRALFAGEVEVKGDMEVARRLQTLLRRLDLDWQGRLADWFGERVGRSLADSLQAAVDWPRQAAKTVAWNLAEFLQEETHLVPAPLEAEDLYRQISTLRDDVERLEARLQRLITKVYA